MPKLSAFTPLGMFSFSSRPSHAETIYRALIAADGGNFGRSAYHDAKRYAQAMTLARARYTLERAFNQMRPMSTTEMLPRRENEYGLHPDPSATLDQRRRALQVKLRQNLGATEANIHAGVVALLGDAFLEMRVVQPEQAQTYPTNPATGPGTFLASASSRYLLRLLQPIHWIGPGPSVPLVPTPDTGPAALPLDGSEGSSSALSDSHHSTAMAYSTQGYATATTGSYSKYAKAATGSYSKYATATTTTTTVSFGGSATDNGPSDVLGTNAGARNDPRPRSMAPREADLPPLPPFVPVAYGGQSVRVHIDTYEDAVPAAGDVLVCDPDLGGRAEKITLSAAGVLGTEFFLQAVFTKTHEEGTYLARQPWPYWMSTKRHLTFVVRPVVFDHKGVLVALRTFLSETLRDVTTWSIVSETGPFLLGSSTLGRCLLTDS